MDALLMLLYVLDTWVLLILVQAAGALQPIAVLLQSEAQLPHRSGLDMPSGASRPEHAVYILERVNEKIC